MRIYAISVFINTKNTWPLLFKMKPLNMLSRPESVVKAGKFTLSCQTFMIAVVPKVGQKFRHVMPPHMDWQHTKVHHMKRILG